MKPKSSVPRTQEELADTYLILRKEDFSSEISEPEEMLWHTLAKNWRSQAEKLSWQKGSADQIKDLRSEFERLKNTIADLRTKQEDQLIASKRLLEQLSWQKGSADQIKDLRSEFEHLEKTIADLERKRQEDRLIDEDKLREIINTNLREIDIRKADMQTARMTTSKQQGKTSHEIESFLKMLSPLHVDIPLPDEIRDYLSQHPDMTNFALSFTTLTSEQFGPDVGLSLELYKDPEIEDEYLTLFVKPEQSQRHEYYERFWSKIRLIRSEYAKKIANLSGWFLVTIDTRLPEARA